MKSAGIVLLSLGCLALPGCADPEATAYDAVLLYAAPIKALDVRDCAGSLERARAGHEATKAALPALRKKIDGVRSDDRFQHTFDTTAYKLIDTVRDFPASCLAEARALNAMLQENAAALGIAAAPQWFDATPSPGPHRCVRADMCEQYTGSGQSRGVRRYVCEEINGSWSPEPCPRRGSGACRYDVGGEMESAIFSYRGSPAVAEEGCGKQKSGPPGIWEPFAPASAPASSVGSPASLPSPAAAGPSSPVAAKTPSGRSAGPSTPASPAAPPPAPAPGPRPPPQPAGADPF